MSSRYSSDSFNQYAPDKSVTSMGRPSAKQKKDEEDAGFWNFVGDLAPTAGTVLGGIGGALIGGIPTGGVGAAPGAALGATLGNSIGQAVGAGSKSHASSLTSDYEDEAQNKEMRRQEFLSVLSGLRR